MRVLFVVALFCYSLVLYGQKGLVAYWNFDKTVGSDFRDVTGNTHNISTINAYPATGISGTALSLNGTDSYAKMWGKNGIISPEISELKTGSISLWFKVNNIPIDHGIAPILYFGASKKCDYYDAANQGLIIEIGHSPIYPENENIFYTVWSGGCTDPTLCFDSDFKIIKGVWHHFVVVIGADYNTAYFNGVELVDRNYNFGENTSSQFFDDSPKKQELWLGKGYWDRTEQFFDGDIDELKIFDVPLNASEVEKLYNEFTVTLLEETEVIKRHFTIYPNPSDKLIELDLNGLGFTPKFISLTTINGSQVLVQETTTKKATINVSGLPEGLYTLRFFGNSNVKSQKVMIKH